MITEKFAASRFEFETARVEILRAAMIMSLSIVFPLLIHGIPSLNGVVWGARVLPLFYMPVIAVLFVRLPFALIISLCAPFLNHVLIHNPVRDKIIPLSGELVLFTLGVYALMYFKRSYCIPLACVAAKAMVFLVMSLSGCGDSRLFISSLVDAIPGLVLLFGGGVWLHVFQIKNTQRLL